ncbi:hypothetical protein [Asanoa siamensis]|nr:hypothetical protein [Asanoa siamensis]
MTVETIVTADCRFAAELANPAPAWRASGEFSGEVASRVSALP